MAHLIDFTKGSAGFFSVREKAWHGLGSILDNCPTSEEAIKFAGLDFEVEKESGFLRLTKELSRDEAAKEDLILLDRRNGRTIYNKAVEMYDKYGTYRTDYDKFLGGVVGSKYEVIQNIEAFNFFDEVVGKKEAIYETAGSLNGGATIFITAKLPGNIVLHNEDNIEKYLLFTMSHDGTGSIQILFTPIRVVCNNTLQFALQGGKDRITIKHTIKAREKLALAEKTIVMSRIAAEELGLVYNHMVDTPIDNELSKLYMKASLGLKNDENGVLSTRGKNILKSVIKYRDNGAGQNLFTTKDTLWGSYNAVTGYFQNVKAYGDTEKAFNSIMNGDGNKKGNHAFELATTIMKNKQSYNDDSIKNYFRTLTN